MTNGLTTVAGMPTGGGVGSTPAPEKAEAKKPEPAPVQQNWWDFYDIAKSAPTDSNIVPMTDYFKEQQEISLQWPEIDGFEPFGYTERN